MDFLPRHITSFFFFFNDTATTAIYTLSLHDALPITRLNTLRRAVFKEILRTAERHKHVLVNTHATFRWKHGLFAAFDFDQMKALKADAYMTIVENVENVHQRLLRDHELDHTLKDIMVWREEELLATEILANAIRGYGHFFMLSRGRGVPTTQ